MPISGSWRVSFSMRSRVDSGEDNRAWINVNGRSVYETEYYTSSSSGVVTSTGGRELTLQASAGDSITLETNRLDGYFYEVQTCFDFIPIM